VAECRPRESPNRLALASSDGSPWLALSSQGDGRMGIKRKLQAGLYANTKRRDNNKTVAVTDRMLIAHFFVRAPARSAIRVPLPRRCDSSARDLGKGPREPSTRRRAALNPQTRRNLRLTVAGGEESRSVIHTVSRVRPLIFPLAFSLSSSLSLSLSRSCWTTGESACFLHGIRCGSDGNHASLRNQSVEISRERGRPPR